MPKVSVIIPNYNHAPFLDVRLKSVLGQTITDIEVIILDDASTDNSIEVIKPYLTDSRVSFYPNEKNTSYVSRQWKKGIDMAKAPFIWIAESDDSCDLDFLEKTLPIFEKYPTVGFVECNSYYMDYHGNFSAEFGSYSGFVGDHLNKELKTLQWSHSFFIKGTENIEKNLSRKCSTTTNASAVVFRKEVFSPALFDIITSFQRMGDWLSYIFICKAYDFYYLNEPLNYFRRIRAYLSQTQGKHEFSLDQQVEQRLEMLRAMQTIEKTMQVDLPKKVVYNYGKFTSKSLPVKYNIKYLLKTMVHFPHYFFLILGGDINRVTTYTKKRLLGKAKG